MNFIILYLAHCRRATTAGAPSAHLPLDSTPLFLKEKSEGGEEVELILLHVLSSQMSYDSCNILFLVVRNVSSPNTEKDLREKLLIKGFKALGP